MKLLLPRLAAFLLLVCCQLFATVHAQTMVRLHTTQGLIDMKMLDGAPITVANFLQYLREGHYNDGVVHRNAWSTTTIPFVIQAGGWRWTPTQLFAIPTRPPIVNEFSASRSNLRRTVAMAKSPSGPNTATSQWFINLWDNQFLDSQNGGFTVFARVTLPGMVTADRISRLPQVDLRPQVPWDSMPVQNWTSGFVNREHAVLITEARELPNATETDRILNFLEAHFTQHLQPSKGIPGTYQGYNFRYYSTSNAYVASKEGSVYYLVPAISNEIRYLATVAELLEVAAHFGY